jgi:hypothetical protein
LISWLVTVNSTAHIFHCKSDFRRYLNVHHDDDLSYKFSHVTSPPLLISTMDDSNNKRSFEVIIVGAGTLGFPE